MDSIVEQFLKKVKSLILVSAQVELRGKCEYFYYYRARILHGNTDRKKLMNSFMVGDFVIDLRLHDRNTPSARNHGTGFRVREDRLANLFSKVSELEL